MIFTALLQAADILTLGSISAACEVAIDAIGKTEQREKRKNENLQRARKFYARCLSEGLPEDKAKRVVCDVYGVNP